MPTQAPDTAIATALVSAATSAPSLHNAQPWHFTYVTASHTLELRADLRRAMPQTDPDNRALHLGCGAALLNLRVAAAGSGWNTEITLCPDPDDHVLLASLSLEPTATATAEADLAALRPAIHRRHTSRYPFEERDIPEAVLAALQDAAWRESAQLVFADAWHVTALLDLVHDAEGRDAMEPMRAEEVEHWTRPGADQAHTAADDGVPQYAFGPRERTGNAPVRDFAGRRPLAHREESAYEKSPHLALLGTTHDSPADWLRAGQAMQRVLLLATRLGLATALTSHALEHTDLRELVRDPSSALGFVHMVLRLGYGPQGPVTPRRPVHQVLDIV